MDQRDYFDKDIANKNNLVGYYVVDKGDYVYNPRVSTNAPVGPISKNKIGKGVMSPLYSVFRFKDSENDFYEQYFKTSHWHQYLRMISNSGARHDRMSITTNDFMDIPLPVPHTDEQHKIADCLSSIDKLITSYTQKHEALKAHKKGLMQQLFPAEGKTVPKLRFPEFRDAPAWNKHIIEEYLTESRTKGSKGDVAKNITVKLWGKGVYEKNDEIKGSVNTQYYCRTAGQFIYSKLDFLNQAFGIIPKNLDNYESTVDLPCFDVNADINPIFLLEYVKRKEFYERLGKAADGSRKAKRIHADTFLNFPIFKPSVEEQQKIADCLSSVDELITAQAQKIELLKAHKKGLMQQLFPATDEVGA